MTSTSLSFAGAALLLEAHSPLAPLADYCLLRAKGLRKPALKRAAEFVAVLLALPDPEQFRLLDLVLTYDRRLNSGLIVGERAWIVPILSRWHEQQPADVRPLVWLGEYADGGREAFMRAALERDPDNVRARSWFVNFYLCEPEYAMHHLDEGVFLGDEDSVVHDLEQAAFHLSLLSDERVRAYYAEDYDDLVARFTDWRQFKTEGAEDFQQWRTDIGPP